MIGLAEYQHRAEARGAIDYVLFLLEQPNWHNLLIPGQGYIMSVENSSGSDYICCQVGKLCLECLYQEEQGIDLSPSHLNQLREW